MQHINMEEFANGAFTQQINRELENVTRNIQDPNTDATAKRRITVVIEFKPNEALNMGKNLKTGEVEAVEIGNQIPGQMSITEVEEDFSEAEPKEEMKKLVDPSTGEIYESTDNVIDLRSARRA